MSWTLDRIRQTVFLRADWAPEQSDNAVYKLTTLVNLAMYRVLEDFPGVFFQDEVRLIAEPDVDMETSSDTISVCNLITSGGTFGADAWAFIFDLDTASSQTLEDRRQFQGRTLWVRRNDDDTEQWWPHVIRDVYTTGAPARYVIVVDRPWENVTDTGLQWRITTEEYPVPPDVVEIKTIEVHQSELWYPLEIIGQEQAAYSGFTRLNLVNTGGVPRYAYRRHHKMLENPKKAPSVAVNLQPLPANAWSGAEPLGSFEYVFSYVFGHQEIFISNPTPLTHTAGIQPIGRHKPWFESAASPESNAVTITDAAHSVEVSLPDIDFTIGFGADATLARYHHSGIRKRIYRRRLTDVSGTLDFSDQVFYLLAEVDGYTTTFIDDGTYVPDIYTRLPEIHGHQTIRPWPIPDEEYDVVMRVTRRPPPLSDDQDVPPIHADAIELLIEKALSYLYEMQGSARYMNEAEDRYQKALFVAKKRYGDLRPASRPLRRASARAQGLRSRRGRVKGPFR